MKTKIALTLIVTTLMVSTGCRSRPERGQPAPTDTANVAATVQAAVAATQTAQTDQQVTVEAAVAATQTASTAQAAPTPTVEVQPTATLAAPTPTPDAETYLTLTEEELAVLIDQAVAQAVAASEEAAAVADDSAADGLLTEEEWQEIQQAVALAEEALALAEELVWVYTDLYGELAGEALVVLQEVEPVLAEMVELLAALTAILEEVEQALAQGVPISEETISQLLTLVETFGVNAEMLQALAEGWLQTLQAELAARAEAALGVLPTQIPVDRLEAIRSTYGYIETVRGALGDNKVSQEELAAIAQAGANAVAGLQAHGGAQLQDLANTLDDITARIAQGQLPDIQALVAGLETALPPLPSRP
ncbi:MAG: hypothetical protein ACOYZ7_05085 [Chloroflexota bacterium]